MSEASKNQPEHAAETSSAWTIEDAQKVAELLGVKFSGVFQADFKKMLENPVYLRWIECNLNPMRFAEVYFSDFDPKHYSQKKLGLTQNPQVLDLKQIKRAADLARQNFKR